MLTRRRNTVLSVSLGAVVLIGIAAATPAAASSPSRIYGPDRFATAVAVSENFPSGVPVVYVATGFNYPDALSAAPAAAAQGGPLLLTPQEALPSNVAAEIQRLAPALIVIVGSEAAVSAQVENQLSDFAPVRRDGGSDRYQTSRIINERAFPSGAASAYIATGRNFPDALSASAAAGTSHSPVVLVDGMASSLDAATIGLLNSLGVTSAKIAGSSVVVSSSMESSLDSALTGPVERLAGDDRYSTSSAINTAAFGSASTAYLAVGTGYADALAGAALAGYQGAPLFIVPGNCVPEATLAAFDSLGVTSHVMLGGPNVLDANVANLAHCDSPPPPPSNPGDVVNCTDFSTHAEAQAWFDTYYPYYGDVAGLDQDNDLIACETLP